ncbi:MAG: hypothetical protein M1821_000018 [Bathelium mastoideum]|nr:MAG: hypothetical protein M1821_000018 [Bathelium mastoideum]
MDQNTGSPEYHGLDRSVAALMTSYHELNSSKVEELDEDPTPLEFMRYVAQNRPFIIRGGAENWNALQKWNAAYLKQMIGSRKVTVAMTLDGKADSVSIRQGQSVFIRPAYRQESFDEILDYISEQEIIKSGQQRLESHVACYPSVKYLQAQNDSLRTEYEELLNDVPASISFARIALRGHLDAINFWLGNSHSVTQLHKDNYENIYVQVLGQKQFVLLPPVDVFAVGEKSCPTADLEYVGTPGIGKTQLLLRYHKPEQCVPFPTWDPDEPYKHATKFSKLANPMRLTLNEGDMLYLPAQWYHKVTQSCNAEGICCAVNYWYDMDFSGIFYPATSFLRSTADLINRDSQLG